MQTNDYATAGQEAEDLLWAAQPEQLQEGMRILACQVVYARRHGAYLAIDEIRDWLETGRKDPAKREVLTEGMERIIEVLQAVGVEPAKKSAI